MKIFISVEDYNNPEVLKEIQQYFNFSVVA